MRYSSLAVAGSVLAASVAAAPYNPFPLNITGFPNATASQVATIQQQAGGSLPNGGLPSSLSDAATLTLQLIALNENFEVAYFNQLVNNITTGVSGYSADGNGLNRTYVLQTLQAILAVRMTHLHSASIYG